MKRVWWEGRSREAAATIHYGPAKQITAQPSKPQHSKANPPTCLSLSHLRIATAADRHRTEAHVLSQSLVSLSLFPSTNVTPVCQPAARSPRLPTYYHLPSLPHDYYHSPQLQPTSPLSLPVILLSRTEINNHFPFPHTRIQANVHIFHCTLPRKAFSRPAEI